MNVDATIVQSPASWVKEQRVGDELADTWLSNENIREVDAVIAKAATVWKVCTSSRLAVDGKLRADGNACEGVDVAGQVLHKHWEQQVGDQ